MDPAHEIPTVDFNAFLHGSDQDRIEVANQVDETFQKHGFLYLKNYGISQERVDEAFRWSKKFHALPLNSKLDLVPTDKSKSYGYTPNMSEIVRGKPCTKEGFGIGNPSSSARTNSWPAASAIPGFKDFCLSFHSECTTLSQHFIHCLSLALSLPPTHSHSLSQHHRTANFSLDLLRYPPVPLHALLSGAQERMRAHSDLGVVTFLFQEDGLEDGPGDGPEDGPDVEALGGLEVAVVGSSEKGSSASYEETGRWRAVPPRRGCVLVNVGFMLKRWTNSRWKSAVHRVGGVGEERERRGREGEGERERGGEDGEGDGEGGEMVPERYSIAFFSLPDMDTVVEALPGTWSEEKPRKWKPVQVGDYIGRKRGEIKEGVGSK